MTALLLAGYSAVVMMIGISRNYLQLASRNRKFAWLGSRTGELVMNDK